MDKKLSPWTNFDPLSTIIFWIYDFEQFEYIKFA